MNRRKAIIGVWHTASKGKTDTLRKLVEVVQDNYPNHIRQFPPPSQAVGSGDIRWVAKIGGLIVAIETQGDPGTRLEDRLVELAETWKADVIFCATRSRGDTVDAVNYISQRYGHEAFWTSTYDTRRKEIHSVVNHQKAKHILELMQTLGYLP